MAVEEPTAAEILTDLAAQSVSVAAVVAVLLVVGHSLGLVQFDGGVFSSRWALLLVIVILLFVLAINVYQYRGLLF